jgi:hypothetical protein
MLEHSRTSGGDNRYVQFQCEDCDNEGHLRHAFDGRNPLDDPDEQDGVLDIDHGLIAWRDCPRCHGGGWTESAGITSERVPCSRCHTSGSVVWDVETDFDAVDDRQVVG